MRDRNAVIMPSVTLSLSDSVSSLRGLFFLSSIYRVFLFSTPRCFGLSFSRLPRGVSVKNDDWHRESHFPSIHQPKVDTSPTTPVSGVWQFRPPRTETRHGGRGGKGGRVRSMRGRSDSVDRLIGTTALLYL